MSPTELNIKQREDMLVAQEAAYKQRTWKDYTNSRTEQYKSGTVPVLCVCLFCWIGWMSKRTAHQKVEQTEENITQQQISVQRLAEKRDASMSVVLTELHALDDDIPPLITRAVRLLAQPTPLNTEQTFY